MSIKWVNVKTSRKCQVCVRGPEYCFWHLWNTNHGYISVVQIHRSSGTSTWNAQPENKTPDCIFPVQRRTKQKVVTDFATVSKGASAGAKPRAALRQVLFSQGVSEKNLASEVLCCLLLVTLHADMLRNRYRLAPTVSLHSNNWKQPQHYLFCSSGALLNVTYEHNKYSQQLLRITSNESLIHDIRFSYFFCVFSS